MSTLKKIFVTILFLSVISIIPISIVNALEIPALDDLSTLITSQLNSNYQDNCDNVSIFYNDNTETFSFYCTTFDGFNSNVATNNIVGNRFLDLRSNFYGLSNIRTFRSGVSNSYRLGGYGTYNGTNWSLSCNYSSCSTSYTLSSNDYLVGFFRILNSYTNSYYVYNGDINSPLFYKNYNLNYYETPVDYFGSYTNYFSQPDNVKGSELDFSGDELSASILDFSYAYINSYMYSFNDIDNEDTLISHQYNYSSPDLSGNYKLGFVITKKTYNDIPVIVHAVTNTGTWACNSITALKNKNDYNYQFYVECPSVNFSDTDDDYLKIVVNGSSEYYQITGPFTWYDTNYLFQDNNNNKYVGISSILRIATDTPPVPVTPDDTTPDNTIDAINNINNNIMDTTAPDTSSLANSAGWLPAGPVDSIINLPITMLSSLNNVLSNSTCSPISVPIPFINFNYSLPCLSTIISNMGFSTWWEWVGTIASAFILYKYLINLYAWVDKTLTFRENNWNDWGGI